MAALLLLDLWIQNEDRSLSEKGGNPNLLVTQVPPLPDCDEEGALWKDIPRREMLRAYDFNLAFDDRFDRARFFDAHVFGGLLKQWPQGFRERMEPRMRVALDRLPELFGELPTEWLHLDGDDTLPVQLDINHVSSVGAGHLLETAMNPPQAACNYAVLRFLPYPETGEFVNVGVVVNCLQPCFFDFLMEQEMTTRMKALFPAQSEHAFAAAAAAMEQEMQRVKAMIRDPKTCQFAFLEAVRPRESTLRFGEVRTLLTTDTESLTKELFKRYVRMEARPQTEPQLIAA